MGSRNYCIFLLLRSAYLFAPPGNARFLKSSDAQITDASALLTVLVLKTTRFKQCKSKVYLPRISDAKYSPLFWLRRILRSRQPSGRDPLFSGRLSGNLQVMTAARFTGYLKKVLTAAGLDPSAYSIHSFRRRGATFAVESAASVEAVNLQGNWRSDCYQKYVKREDKSLAEFAAAMAAGIETCCRR